MGFAAMAAAAVVGAAVTSEAAGDAADTQAAAAQDAASLERQTARENLALQERQYQEGVARQQPYYEAGKSALARLQAGIATGGEFTKQFGGVIDDPSYQFRLQQGQRALDASAAAKGQLFTGGQQQAVQKFGQDLASTEYSAAYNRFIDERQRQLANVSGLASVGSQTASGLANLGQQYASNASNTAAQSAQNQSGYLTGGAAAQAAGAVGQANAWNNSIGQGIGIYQNQQQLQMLQNYLKPTPAITPAPAITPTPASSNWLTGTGNGSFMA